MKNTEINQALKVARELSGRETDQECWQCEEGTFVRDNYDIVCGTCYFSPDGSSTRRSRTTLWEDFWDERADEYDGHYGEDRKKCVGGFGAAYL